MAESEVIQQLLNPSLNKFFLSNVLLFFGLAWAVRKVRGKCLSTEPGWVVLVLAMVFAGASVPISTAFSSQSVTHADEKIYSDFDTFYVRYEKEHEVPQDRVAHVILFVAMAASMFWNPRYVVAWCASMGVGALLTKPLLACSMPWQEAYAMSAAGALASSFYGGEVGFFLRYAAWLTGDYLSHVFLGMNGPVALWIGENYLAFGLWGQCHLVFGILRTSLGGVLPMVAAFGTLACVCTRARWVVSPPYSPEYVKGAKTIFITGCASGLGKKLAEYAASQGHRVIATDLNKQGLPEQVAMAARLDVTSRKEWEETYAAAVKRFGQVDVHINCAGYLKAGDGVTDSEQEMHRHLDVNVKGVVNGSQVAAAHMCGKGSGHIINIGSLAALVPAPGLTLYAASKFAVRAYSLGIARGLEGSGVAVSVLCPDAILTPMLVAQKDSKEAATTFSGSILTTDEVADCVFNHILPTRLPEVWLPYSRGFLARLVDVLGPGNAVVAAAHPVLQRIGMAKQSQMKQ